MVDSMEKVVVIGSLNMDLVAQVPQLPQRGQTIAGFQFQMLPGGKGANQAFAIGRLGGTVRMIGRVGDDLFGERLKASLNSVGVSVESVLSTAGESTGIALILVETGGENQIVVAAGANGRLSPDDVRAELERTPAQYLLLQLETPLPTVEAAAIEGRRRGMSVILDPAPATPLSSSLLSSIDILTPNESEALVLLGSQGESISLDQAEEVCSKLLALGPSCVILKMGQYGVWFADRNQSNISRRRRFMLWILQRLATPLTELWSQRSPKESRSKEQFPLRTAPLRSRSLVLGAQASVPSRREVEEMLAR